MWFEELGNAGKALLPLAIAIDDIKHCVLLFLLYQVKQFDYYSTRAATIRLQVWRLMNYLDTVSRPTFQSTHKF